MLRNIFGLNSESDSDSSNEVAGAENDELADQASHSNSEVVHVSKSNRRICLKQTPERGIAHQLWPAASFLCDYIEDHTDELMLSETPVLELGAGIGLCGIFAACLGSPRVLITDLNEALPTIEENVICNSVQSSSLVRELCWGNETHAHSAMSLFDQKAPIVIAADCVYWECLYTPLLETLRILVVEYGCTVIMAHVRRWKKDGKFFNNCKKIMNVETLVEIVDTVEDVDRVLRRVRRIYKMCKKT